MSSRTGPACRTTRELRWGIILKTMNESDRLRCRVTSYLMDNLVSQMYHCGMRVWKFNRVGCSPRGITFIAALILVMNLSVMNM